MLRLLLLFFLLQPFVSGYALPEDIVITNDTEDMELSNLQYEIFKDSSPNLSIEKIVHNKQIAWYSADPAIYNYVEDPDVTYWLKFRIRNNSDQYKKWVLEYLSVHTESFEFFIPVNDSLYTGRTIGQKIPFDVRDYKLSNFVFDLPLLSGEEKVFFAKIRSRHPSGFEFHIRSQSYFTSYAVYEYYFLGIYYGILFIMAIYNLLLYFSSREKVYLFYVLYVFSCMLNSYAEDGLGFQFIWSGLPEVNWTLNNHLSSLLFLFTFILYASGFLELNKQAPKVLKLIYASVALYLALYVIGLILPWSIHLSVIYILPFLIVYAISIILYRGGYKPARFFILGYSFVFISILIMQLRNYNLIPHNIFTVYSFNYGILLEVVVLSLALGDRIRLLKLEKDKAQKVLIEQLEENQKLQQKVNRELEDKVNQRTKLLVEKTMELEDANIKLQKMTEELNKFASKLDKDNWELNKKVIEEKKARMNSRELSFEEFTKLYPNDFTCLKLIEELKWGSGYECKKCKHTRFAVKAKLLARKCSKCNYIESVTASTIFHAVKFPIQKAFYIAYITSVGQDKISVDKLSEILEMNRLTCYKFRKKVITRSQIMIQNKKLERVDNWENLIIDSEQ